MFRIIIASFLLVFSFAAYAGEKDLFMSVDEYNDTKYQPGNNIVRRLSYTSKPDKRYIVKALKTISKAQNKPELAQKTVDLDNIEEMSDYFKQSIGYDASEMTSYELLNLDKMSDEEEKNYLQRLEQEKQKKQAAVAAQQAVQQKEVKPQNTGTPTSRRRFSR